MKEERGKAGNRLGFADEEFNILRLTPSSPPGGRGNNWAGLYGCTYHGHMVVGETKICSYSNCSLDVCHYGNCPPDLSRGRLKKIAACANCNNIERFDVKRTVIRLNPL